MLRKLVAAFAITISGIAGVAAQSANLPGHDAVCVSGVVSKKKLALYLLASDPSWNQLALKVDRPASNPRYEPQWRKIFADPRFCMNDPACNVIPPAKKKAEKKRDDTDTLNDIRNSFINFVVTGTKSKIYSTDNPDITADVYFASPENQNRIFCAKDVDVAAPYKPPVDLSNIRIRGVSDDLYFDRNRDKAAFKSTSTANGSVTADHSAARTTTTKVQAAIGYAIPLDINDTALFHSLYADLVPYVSFVQSITDTEGKPRALGASNNVAVGILDTAFIHFNGDFPANHAITFKPQYLWNTKDQSEIASLKFIWAPWTFIPSPGAPVHPDINTAFRVPFLWGGTYVRLLFDLRNDTGTYTDKGNDPVAASMKTNFGRAGTKFGVALTTTDPSFLPLTLLITETYMYGYTGDARRLDLFEASLSYALDPNGYFNLKTSYQNGRDETTAAAIQGWTVGLAARY